MENRLSIDWVVPLSLCDDRGVLSTQGALEEFMNIAAQHAEQLGIGGAAMAQRGLFWLTVRSRVRFHARPAMLETVTAETWPGETEGLRSERYYALRRGGVLLAEARTQWAVFDLAKKRVIPAAGVFPPELVFSDERVCTEGYAPLREVPEEEVSRYTVRSVDIDIGHHMNNVAYVGMLLGTLPTDALHTIREMQTHYRRPCLEGETLSIRRRQTEDGWRFAVVKENGETAVTAQLLR